MAAEVIKPQNLSVFPVSLTPRKPFPDSVAVSALKANANLPRNPGRERILSAALMGISGRSSSAVTVALLIYMQIIC